MRTVYKYINAAPVRWLVALSWMLFLTILLVQPLDQPLIPTGVQPAPPSFTRELFFSTVHGIIFGITAIIWTWTLNHYFSLRKAMWIAVLCLLVYGIGTEFAQSRTPGRDPQRIDILANVLGSMIGAWVVYHWLADLLRKITTTRIFQPRVQQES